MSRTLTVLVAAALATPAAAQPPVAPAWPPVPVYRLRNIASGEFMYSADPNEVATLARAGTHQAAGPVFSVLPGPGLGTVPLVRYVRSDGTHFLATSPQPAQAEVILGHVSARPRPGTVPVITWHDDSRGYDFYATDPGDRRPARWGFRRADVLGYALP